MPRNRRVFERNQSHFVTFRAEEGLPLPPNPVIKRLLSSILCKAKALYAVEVSAFKFMANHAHFIITVIDPEAVDDFVRYVKGESAHVINRLLGRRQRTVWCEGYDAPRLLDVAVTIEKIIYIYTNAQESNLVDTIEEYPGLSSWNQFISGEYILKRRRIKRSSVKKLPQRTLRISDHTSLAEKLEAESLNEENTFCLSPYAWLKSFDTQLTEEEAKKAIIDGVRSREEYLRLRRKGGVIGAKRLQLQDMRASHTPEKFGKRMICLSTSKELRKSFISWFQEMSAQARHVYRNVKRGLQQLYEMPPGMFSPGGLLFANIWQPA